MSARRGFRRRGQNLVLLALTMLALVLMVTMTVGLGLRIRQKRELQQLADASAYSNAVMTARTFNNMALLNRLQVSYWVAMAADQSLLSWTAYARAMGNGTAVAANALASQNCVRRLPPRTRRQLADFRSDVAAYLDREYTGGRGALWRQMDFNAGKEALAIQGQIAALRFELAPGVVTPAPDSRRDELFRQLRTQQLTRQILALSRQADVSLIENGAGREPNTAAQVSLREVDCDYGGSGDEPLNGTPPAGTGLCLRASWNENMLQAAMGSRGNRFLTGRTQVPGKARTELEALAARYGDLGLAFAGKSGSAYWSTRKSHGVGATNTEAWGDDDGLVIVSAGNCTQPQALEAHVRSTHLLDDQDEHAWNPPRSGVGEDRDAPGSHTMGDCTPLCPSVWVRTIGFQPSTDVADAWGQPKVMVALQRDLAARQFPWELHFSFPFSATGPAAGWDARGQRLQGGASRGLNISQQAAFSTGIAYYHRRGHWDEFPNLLNPFWRATLAAHDVDATGPTDVRRALSAPGHRWQRDAYDALRAQGYEGLH